MPMSHCMRKVISILLLFYYLASYAQQNLPPVYKIDTNTITLQLPQKYIHVFPDKKGTLTIQQVSNPPFANQFVPVTEEFNYFSSRTHWQQFRIRNGMTKNAKVGFFEGSSFLSDNESSDYYLKHQ